MGEMLQTTVVMIMELSRSFRCKELKRLDVVDTTGEKVGTVGDITFKFDGELKIEQFVLAGSPLEELLENLKLKPDKDELFNASHVEKITDKIYLNTTIDTLKTTLDKGAISEDEIRLSKLKKLSILDKDGETVGTTIDVDIDMDGSSWLTVGGGFVEEKLEALGLKADVDIIVPCRLIDKLGDEITLKVSKSDLNSTMEEALKGMKPEARMARQAKTQSREDARVRLFAQRPF